MSRFVVADVEVALAGESTTGVVLKSNPVRLLP